MGIFQTTPEGRYLSANRALAVMLGYESPEELIHTVSDVNRQVYVDPHQRTELLRLIEAEGIVIARYKEEEKLKAESSSSLKKKKASTTKRSISKTINKSKTTNNK